MNNRRVRFGKRRDCQGALKTKGTGAKRLKTQKKRHKLGNRTNMCKQNGGICLIVEVYSSKCYCIYCTRRTPCTFGATLALSTKSKATRKPQESHKCCLRTANRLVTWPCGSHANSLICQPSDERDWKCWYDVASGRSSCEANISHKAWIRNSLPFKLKPVM